MTVIVLGRDNTNRLFIGYERENDARAIAFDFSVWAMQYGPGVLTLLIQRPGDANPYPVVLDIDGNVATWYPSATDTAVSGEGGMIQLIYSVDSIVAKTHIYYLCIGPSIGTGTTPPSGYETWLETLTEIAGQAQEDAASASASADAAAAAQAAIEDMTVSAVTLEPDEPATVEKTEVGGIVNLEFGIPKGKDGSGGGGGTPYDLNPEALGAASPGITEEYSRGDHVHPMPSASDVGALPDSTVIPAKVSQLQNDSGFVNAAQAASAAPVQSVNGQVGAVSLTKASVGLGNVDNTSDANKPVSTAQAAALAEKLPLSGGTMSGAVAMGGYKVTGLGTPVNDGDASTKKYVDDAIAGIGTVFTIKGDVAAVADLPATGNAVGDVYYVQAVSAAYVWLETTAHPTGYWEEFGEPIDLSGYIEKPTSATANQILTFNGTNWVAANKPSYTASEVGALPADTPIPSTASDVGAIAAPSSPATGSFLVWNGSAWVAQTLATWQASSY